MESGEGGNARRFVDRVAVVTGGASGIGAATVRVLASEGATVVIADINKANGESLASELVNTGHETVFVECDVGEQSAGEALIGEVVSRYGQIDLLHNNAAAIDAVSLDHDVLSVDGAIWDASMRVNARGPLLLSRCVAAHDSATKRCDR